MFIGYSCTFCPEEMEVLKKFTQIIIISVVCIVSLQCFNETQTVLDLIDNTHFNILLLKSNIEFIWNEL